MGWENGVSQDTISYGANKDHILVRTVLLKPMIKAHFSAKMVSSGISDVVIASVYRLTKNERMTIALAEDMARSTTDIRASFWRDG